MFRALKNTQQKAIKAPKRLKTIAELEAAGLIPSGSGDDYRELAQAYDIALTDHVAGLIERANDPVGLQYVPRLEELSATPREFEDPIGDEARSPLKGIIHRYPDRILLKVTHICAVYCRYCFRREMIGTDVKGLAEQELGEALAYIENHAQVWEVILTGGDPLVLSPRRLQNLVERLNAIPHVRLIRFHTRVPIAAPDIINETILSVLKNSTKPIYMVLHINHVNEISDNVKNTVEKLRLSGCSLLSQSVLLRGVNDDAYTLETLFKTLLTLHIKPYYLHHPDLAKGTSHFRVSIKKGQAIMRALQGRISGLALPTYVLDIPGGYGKVPVSPAYIQECQEGYILEDFQGAKHHYSDPDCCDD